MTKKRQAIALDTRPRGRRGPESKSSPRQQAQKALRWKCAELLNAGWKPVDIAEHLNRSPRTISNWMLSPEVRAMQQELNDAAKEAAKGRIADVAVRAWETLRELMEPDIDPKVRLEAAKTILSRKGEPEMSRSESLVEQHDMRLHVHITPQEADRVLMLTEEER